MKNNLTTKQLEKIILKTCYEAGRHIRENAYSYLDIRWKKPDDPVTRLDTEAEQMIRTGIAEFTDATFYGEEYGKKKGTSDVTIFIDPIDGTKSFIKKEFCSSVSIAAEIHGELVIGCVYDFMKDVMYYANEEKAYVITPAKKRMSLPLLGMPRFSKPNINVDDLDDVQATKFDANLRKQTGSIALGMAQLAAGSINGMILTPYRKDGKSDTCDIAAGYHIMRKSGIIMTDYDGKQYDYRNPSNGLIALDKDLADIRQKRIMESRGED